MELKDLTGPHSLDAVNFTTAPVQNWAGRTDVCNVVRFRLDGVVYMAVEDPEDGYRSMMRSVAVGTGAMSYAFPPLQVVAVYRSLSAAGSDSGTCDILELIDAVTGKTVLKIGTENTDDYYPFFVALYSPEAMAHNANTVGGT